MKKYIRTYIQIIETAKLKELTSEKYVNDCIQSGCFKTSDNLEDLCDEFVFDDGEGEPLLCTTEDKYEELIYWFNYSKKQQYKIRNCYGAIWTDKGLIYVAKMNQERELELL